MNKLGIILAVSLILLVSGCVQQPGQNGGTGSLQPDFTIESPSNNAMLETGVTQIEVRLATSNFSIGEVGAPNKLNEGHFHWYLDNGTYNPVTSTAFTVTGLTSGTHTIRVTMNNNDHTEKGIEKSVTIKVTGASPNFSVKTPAEGQTFDNFFEAELVPINFSIGTAGTANQLNQGHFHMFMDGGDYIVVEGLKHRFSNLSPGLHTLRVTMNNNDHSSLGIEKLVSFNVQSSNPVFQAKLVSTTETTAKFQISTWNFTLTTPGGANSPNKGHFHYFLDGGTYNVLNDSELEIRNLSPGSHTLRIVLQNNDHSDYLVNGEKVEQTIEFQVNIKSGFTISSPANNAKVGSPVTIQLQLNNFSIGTIGTPNKLNQGHFHWFLDGGTYNVLTDSEFTLTGLKPGQHTVRIQAHNNDHSSIPSIPSQTVKFYIETSKSGFEIKTPVITGNNATFTLEWWNFNIGRIGDPKRVGYGHFHYFVDGGEYIVLEKSSFTLTNLSSGTHTLRVVMQYNDHTDYLVDGASVERSLQFTMP